MHKKEILANHVPRRTMRTVAAVAALTLANGMGGSGHAQHVPAERLSPETAHSSAAAIVATGLSCSRIDVRDVSAELPPQTGGESQQNVEVSLDLALQPDALKEVVNYQTDGIVDVSHPTVRAVVLADGNPDKWLSRATVQVPSEGDLVTYERGSAALQLNPVIVLKPTGLAPGTTAMVGLEQSVTSQAADGSMHKLTGFVPCGVTQFAGGGATPHWQKVQADPQFMQAQVYGEQGPVSATPVLR